MYIAGTFKTFGQKYLKSEATLSDISSVSAVFNAVCYNNNNNNNNNNNSINNKNNHQQQQ